jgi:hypothetical protein
MCSGVHVCFVLACWCVDMLMYEMCSGVHVYHVLACWCVDVFYDVPTSTFGVRCSLFDIRIPGVFMFITCWRVDVLCVDVLYDVPTSTFGVRCSLFDIRILGCVHVYHVLAC